MPTPPSNVGDVCFHSVMPLDEMGTLNKKELAVHFAANKDEVGTGAIKKFVGREGGASEDGDLYRMSKPVIPIIIDPSY